MDVLDKFLRKVSYKFPKGYPDINDAQDMLMLEGLLENLGVKIPLHEEVPNRSNTVKAVKKIIDAVGSKYGLSALKSKPNRLSAPGVKDPNTFLEIIKDTFGPDTKIEVFGPRKGPNPSGKFNLYQFNTEEFGEVNMVASYSAPGGAGVDNEQVFINNLNDLIAQAGESANIIITSPQHTLKFKNVGSVIDTSKLGAQGGEKSDVRFLSPDNKTVANISLKKDGGFRWASVASYDKAKPLIKNFTEKGLDINSDYPVELKPNPEVDKKYLMYDRKTGERITKLIIPDFIDSDQEIDDFIFGPEDPKVVVVGGSWKDSDFSLSGDTITAQASSIYKNLDDVEKANADPVFVVAQHQGKPLGLDFRIFPKSGASPGSRARAKFLSYDEIMS